MVRRCFLFVSLSFLACSAAGCGGGTLSAPGAVPVKGQVWVKGKAVAGVLVTFHPRFDIGSIKFKPSGLTDKEGRFTISTAAPNDGAPPGEYAVTFTFPRAASDKKTGLDIEVDAWEGKYANPDQSKWTVKVGHGPNELEPFRLD